MNKWIKKFCERYPYEPEEIKKLIACLEDTPAIWKRFKESIKEEK